MTDLETPVAAGSVATDRQDERLRAQGAGVSGVVRSAVDRAKGGDLGILPVAAGLLVIWAVFQSLNPIFLSSANLVNLAMESVPVGVIALGIVVVLLLGQIDLSVGSVSGLSSALVAVLFVNQHLPVALAIVAAVLSGTVIGLVYGQLFNRFGIPSFVITLAGLLAFLGLQLYVLGKEGSINIPFDSRLVFFAQLAFVPHPLAYVLAVLAAGGLFATGPGAGPGQEEGRPVRAVRTAARAAQRGAAGGAAVRHLLPQPRPRDRLDGRVLRRARAGHALRPDADALWPHAVRGRRQRRGVPPGRHQRQARLHLGVRPVLHPRRDRRGARRLPARGRQPGQRHR